MASGLPRPPYAPGLKPALDQIKAAGFNTKPKKEDIGIIRQFTDNSTNINNVLAGRAIQHEEQTIPSSDGSNAELTISIFRPSSSSSTTTPTTTHPCIYYTHGGGFISGTRHLGVSSILDWVESLPAICISIEYRLPPEHPDPTPLEDCYDGLLWISSHASELGINPDCLLLAGISAGGGLAAGLALLARDRKGPKIRAQILVCPMLDDRDATVSAHQYSDEGFWSRECNQLGWSCLLGERAGGEDGEVSTYAAPGRAADLSGLPEAFLDCGSAEVFRDETVAYASLLWKCGVQAELHVWPGGFHAFSFFAPGLKMSVTATEVRTAWVKRVLSST